MLETKGMERLNRHALIIAPLLVVGGFLWSWEMGLSIVIGGLLAWLNLRWMMAGVDRLLVKSGSGQKAEGSAISVLKYLFRLLLIFIVLFAMIHFSFLSPIGALLGLSIYVLSGMLEAILLLIQRKV